MVLKFSLFGGFTGLYMVILIWGGGGGATPPSPPALMPLILYNYGYNKIVMSYNKG